MTLGLVSAYIHLQNVYVLAHEAALIFDNLSSPAATPSSSVGAGAEEWGGADPSWTRSPLLPPASSPPLLPGETTVVNILSVIVVSVRYKTTHG